ncbi:MULTISPECIES: hypothetical protein [Streptomyces]|uniref:Uncharacterized protein n=1 Tax=Streptomyces sviceus (strain ATCC 29083 / DSM 924 / JCM 4929 / NBRC 13980 / NCIMB 11184 / NRRL 5439 / UC 5370) TaxID=463191 RepID=B5HSD6_STRX2|nr:MULTISPECIES: hypothetical protein [Streptomyces]EDY55741.1 conserved hypothetical protein [Streptomyces sviceus ATCC 29083]MYT10811.1 hypothetical protein [Streptomyces sp. SID5470]
MTIKTNDDLVVRLYRSYVRLRDDIRADDDLDRRFEHALDAVETQLATHHPHRTWRPRHRRSRLAGSVRSAPRGRTAITAAAVTLCTTLGGALQGAVGAVISLSASLFLACTVALIQHGPARHD